MLMNSRRVSSIVVLLILLAWHSNLRSSAIAQVADWPVALEQQAAWDALPKADTGSGTKLPTWARMLARTLPHTTAASIELEYLYRTEPLMIAPSRKGGTPNPIDGTRLASIARYAVASYHESAYGTELAISDLKRNKASVLAETLLSDPSKLPPLEQEVFVFARQMSELGRDLTDEQYRSLQSQLGDEAMVGLVLRIAQACFQDRMLWALGISKIADANPEPIYVHFTDSTANGANTPTALRQDPEDLIASIYSDKQIGAPTSNRLAESETETAKRFQGLENWKDLSFAEMQKNLTAQRERQPRIAVPEWETIAPKLPQGLYRRPLPIRWSRVVVGYQTKLGPAWIKCLRVFEQEAHQDRVFEESVFWVVTRGLKCFYCMGHCEMLMEVGGLKRPGIDDRTFRLASGKWETFSKSEQDAFSFAKKLTESPTQVTLSDRNEIRQSLGETRALDLIWWSSRCQFMTKVSDAFQLQLESENVFAD